MEIFAKILIRLQIGLEQWSHVSRDPSGQDINSWKNGGQVPVHVIYGGLKGEVIARRCPGVSEQFLDIFRCALGCRPEEKLDSKYCTAQDVEPHPEHFLSVIW